MRFWKTELPLEDHSKNSQALLNRNTRSRDASFVLNNAERVSLVLLFIWLLFDWLF